MDIFVSWDAGEDTEGCELALIEKLGAKYEVLAVNTLCSSSKGQIERGVHLKFLLDATCSLREETRLRIWPDILAASPCFRCARVHVAGGFEGCVLDFIRPSQCPSAIWEVVD